MIPAGIKAHEASQPKFTSMMDGRLVSYAREVVGRLGGEIEKQVGREQTQLPFRFSLPENDDVGGHSAAVAILACTTDALRQVLAAMGIPATVSEESGYSTFQLDWSDGSKVGDVDLSRLLKLAPELAESANALALILLKDILGTSGSGEGEADKRDLNAFMSGLEPELHARFVKGPTSGPFFL